MVLANLTIFSYDFASWSFRVLIHLTPRSAFFVQSMHVLCMYYNDVLLEADKWTRGHISTFRSTCNQFYHTPILDTTTPWGIYDTF